METRHNPLLHPFASLAFFGTRFRWLHRWQALRLLQMTGKAKPARFANTSVDVAELLRLSRFLAEVAGERP